MLELTSTVQHVEAVLTGERLGLELKDTFEADVSTRNHHAGGGHIQVCGDFL